MIFIWCYYKSSKFYGFNFILRLHHLPIKVVWCSNKSLLFLQDLVKPPDRPHPSRGRAALGSHQCKTAHCYHNCHGNDGHRFPVFVLCTASTPMFTYVFQDWSSPFSPHDFSQQATLSFPRTLPAVTHISTFKTAHQMTSQWHFVAEPVSKKKTIVFYC